MTDYRGIQEKFHQVAESLKCAVEVIQELEHDFEAADTESPGPRNAGAPHPGAPSPQGVPPGTPPFSTPAQWYNHPSYAAMMSNLMSQMMTHLNPETNGTTDPGPGAPAQGSPMPEGASPSWHPGLGFPPMMSPMGCGPACQAMAMPMWGFGMPGWAWPGAPWSPFWMGWGGANPNAAPAQSPAPTFPGSWTWSWEPRETPSGPQHVHASSEGDATQSG